jgi:hypothetical protein
VFNDLREQLADRVYGPLFGTDELHCSKDGFALLRPQGPVETAEGLEVFVPPKFNLNHRAHDSAHVDSGGSRLGLHGIQVQLNKFKYISLQHMRSVVRHTNLLTRIYLCLG